ncbi:hypothetical protein [Paeniglutamicibacter kerguelensis]|uniref:Uncharacterized protein n=1 Tax=Paeniglutamicibacter kerguelensis TaxID=254788 RepID=A0ABS4X818_9MICC|nr:hypothetical protein [Paeniglutamicibacter kerguelensis]MBP2384606.1 hypothetical protein [Paeniglutamicibacter kerguelensis]
MEQSVPVLPLFDLHRAVIELNLHGSWRSFQVNDAPSVARALADSVEVPRWDPASSSLLVRTPVTGNTAGRTRIFSLVEFSEARPTAKVVR